MLGCPVPVMEHSIRQTARDFCERSGAWREWVTAFTATGVSNRFNYTLATGQELVRVARALINGEDLPIKAGAALPVDWESGTSLAGIDALIHFNETEFMLFPKPTAGDVVTCEMVFRPSHTALDVADVIFTKYAQVIAAGSLAHLLNMPRQEWSEHRLVADYRRQYEAGISWAANADFQRTALHRVKSF